MVCGFGDDEITRYTALVVRVINDGVDTISSRIAWEVAVSVVMDQSSEVRRVGDDADRLCIAVISRGVALRLQACLSFGDGHRFTTGACMIDRITGDISRIGACIDGE